MIPAEMRDSVFDPYVTTKRDGTGLGLTIVQKICMDHGGSIESSRSPLGGARFSIVLPEEGSEEEEESGVRFGVATAAGADFWIQRHVGFFAEFNYNLLFPPEEELRHEIGGVAGVVLGL